MQTVSATDTTSNPTPATIGRAVARLDAACGAAIRRLRTAGKPITAPIEGIGAANAALDAYLSGGVTCADCLRALDVITGHVDGMGRTVAA